MDFTQTNNRPSLAKNGLTTNRQYDQFLFITIAAQLGPQGQLDSIKLRFPQKAIPGSVGAVIYLTGESIVILFDVSLN